MWPSRNQWRRWSLPSKLTAIGAYLGAVGILLTIGFALLSLSDQKHSSPLTPSEVEIVQASIDDLQPHGFPVLEFKLRNTGESVAFIKEAVINVSQIEHLWDPRTVRETHVDVSYKYDVSLRLSGAPYTIRADLAQSIGPNDVDRFVLAMAYDELNAESLMHRMARDLAFQSIEKGEEVSLETIEQELGELPDDVLMGIAIESERILSIVVMTVELVYDAGNRRVPTQPLMFIMPKVDHYLMSTEMQRSNAAEIIRDNTERFNSLVQEFSGVMSPGVRKLIEDIAEP